MLSNPKSGPQLVESVELPEYPISASERLDSHFFMPWNLKRWRASELRKSAYSEPEVGFYAFELFCKAQDETPVGTLPRDDSQLAFMLHMSTDKWSALRKRDISPLHGWYEVQCDNGEIRLGHDVVQEVALEALGSRRRNQAKNADDRMRKRLGTIRKCLAANLKNNPAAANDENLINRINDWIEDVHPGGSATERRIKDAWEAISATP